MADISLLGMKLAMSSHLHGSISSIRTYARAEYVSLNPGSGYIDSLLYAWKRKKSKTWKTSLVVSSVSSYIDA